MAMREFKVKDYARREQVTEWTVRQWIAKGAVEVRRTAGGGVRIVERDSRAIIIAETQPEA